MFAVLFVWVICFPVFSIQSQSAFNSIDSLKYSYTVIPV
jgi:hypothetical protein